MSSTLVVPIMMTADAVYSNCKVNEDRVRRVHHLMGPIAIVTTRRCRVYRLL